MLGQLTVLHYTVEYLIHFCALVSNNLSTFHKVFVVLIQMCT